MKSIKLKGRILKYEGEEKIRCSVFPLDDSAREFAKKGFGARANKRPPVRFLDILKEFNHDDVVEITFKVVA